MTNTEIALSLLVEVIIKELGSLEPESRGRQGVLWGLIYHLKKMS